MKKGQIREGIVIDVKFPNKGIVKLLPPVSAEPGIPVKEADAGIQAEEQEEYCTIKNGLPGQRISLMITKVRKGKGEGRVLQVLAPSPDEVQASCPHFGTCGGCTYLSLPYEKQLSLKEKQVKELLDSVLCGQDQPWEFEPIKASPVQQGYRNKMEFSFGDEVKDGPLALGMHKRGSFYDIVSVKECRIVDGDYRQILRGTLGFFTEQKASYFHRLTHVGYLRHLLVRKASHTGEILIALVTTTQEERDLLPFRDMLLALPLQGKIAGILHIENDSVADVVKSDRTTILHGQDFFYEELLGLKFKVSVFSFFQTNSYGAQVLYQTAREYIGRLDKEDCVVYDLYSGTGTIAQLMAPVAGKVIGVEIVEEAVEAAKKNAGLNGLSNCEFIAGDVLKVLDDIAEKPDFIILDPPRDGIHPRALQKIITYGVDRMVYISCKPTSLVRDLEVLLGNGYVVEKAVAVDQFPWTTGIEMVVLLSKGEVDSKKIRVEFSLEDMDMSEFQDGATYTQIKDYVLEHSGLKVSNLYISQIKRKCGIEVGKNYNLPKSEDSRQPQCPPEKEKAIREAFKYFGMI